jgi:putative membrane protein
MKLGRFPYPTFRRIRHIIVVWAIETIALLLLDQALPGLILTSGESAALAVAAIGLLNAILRPLFLTLTITITVLTIGLFSFLLNIAVVLLASRIVPGFIINDGVTVILVVLGVTLINMIVTKILALDENNSYYRSVISRFRSKEDKTNSDLVTGLVMIEIDGLSKSVIQSAITKGYMPTLSSWLESNQYKLSSWNCGLPSQTSASQMGILYGENENIPAFRWYEKETQKLIVSNHLNDTALIETRIKTKDFLLTGLSSSIGNMFSGGASRSVMTMSQLSQVSKIPKRSGNFYNFFLNPYNFIRTFFLMAFEFFQEIVQAAIQRFRNHQPRVRRSILFAIERTISSVLLRELTTHLVIEDLFKATQSIYATYVGYDVVAHHAGIDSPASFSVLRGIDKQIERIIQAAKTSNNLYQFVLLSDHGQSQGKTFKQKYGYTLDEMIRGLFSKDLDVESAGASEETKGYINSLLQEALIPHERISQTAKKIYDQMKSGKENYPFFINPKHSEKSGNSDVVICSSGNMALVYFTNTNNRLSLEEISLQYPELIADIVSHPGIGFIMVNSILHGTVVIHSNGIHYLSEERIEGSDLFQKYDPTTKKQLLKLNQYKNNGDLILFSDYDPISQNTSAFEELFGHHGGLGGLQTEAFVLYPSIFHFDHPVLDSVEMHKTLCQWQREIRKIDSKNTGSLN